MFHLTDFSLNEYRIKQTKRVIISNMFSINTEFKWFLTEKFPERKETGYKK